MNLHELLGSVPVPSACSVIVTIPARNEEAEIAGALGAFARQTALERSQVIVFANNCTDATASKARAFAQTHPELQCAVVEASIPPPFDHVGTARKALMDYAADKFYEAGKPRGIIATTDADTRVATDWIESIVREMQTADAVAGLVEIDSNERQTLPLGVRSLYAQENAFRSAWAEVEALLDPLPEDPFPRHCSFVAAAFAVTAETYRRAGGLAAVQALEDRTFLRALRRVDARIRFSREVIAGTSGRCDARVAGGFGTLMRHLHAQGTSGGDFLVENPLQIIEDARGRAALRRLWSGTGSAADIDVAAQSLHVAREVVQRSIDAAEPFGENYERLRHAGESAMPVYPLVSVAAAIKGLQRAAAELKAAAATRSNAASGAG